MDKVEMDQVSLGGGLLERAAREEEVWWSVQGED